MDITFPCEFVVYGTPISSGGSGKSKSKWKQTVKDASLSALPQGHFCYEGPVSLTLYYFPAAQMIGDIDNIIKMTQDALCKHILMDDKQVERVVVQRFNPDGVFQFTDPSEVLLKALTSEESVLYVRISSNPHEELL